MSSSRESTPASETGTTSPAQLTPTSKVKALLASFESESEEENVSGSARARLLTSITKTTKSNTKTSDETSSGREKEINSTGTGSHAESEEDEEEDIIVRPRGRIAAALRAPESDSEEDLPSRTSRSDEGRKSSPANNNAVEPTTISAETGSEESDAPVTSRKRKIRVPRQETPQPSLEKRAESPGLFVSPDAPRSADIDSNSDSDELPEHPEKNDRFNALVEKKRQELLAREKERSDKEAKKAADRRKHAEILEEDEEIDGSDDNDGRRLTQQVRPTRKASKRAIEEMHRETQRLSRNQQLAHNATTKKKFSKQDFLSRFQKPVDTSIRATSSSPAPHSDFEMKDTPPTSPASFQDDSIKATPAPDNQTTAEKANNDEEIPTLEAAQAQATSPSPARLDKGKGKAIEEPPVPTKIKQPVFNQRPIRVRPPPRTDRKASPLDDSDNDLEIVTATTPKRKTKMDLIFDSVPEKKAKESHSLHVLRAMAHLTSPGKQNLGKNKKSSMTTSELQMTLQQRARQQAVLEREEKLQALRAKGIIIQTAEERQQEMAEVEDLLAKARREGDEIMKREKAAAKKEQKERGEAGDSSDDEDWEEGKEKVVEEQSTSDDEEELEESGSENDASDEEHGEMEDEMGLDDTARPTTNPMFDDEAGESDVDEDDAEEHMPIDEDMVDGGDLSEEEIEVLAKGNTRRARNVNIISEDEDEDADSISDQQTPPVAKMLSPAQAKDSPTAPNSVLRSATKTFIPGLTVTGPVGLGLTQIFAGTMDDSQMAPSPTEQDHSQEDSKQDSMAFLRELPAPDLPPFVPTMEEDTQEFDINQSQISHIPESQPGEAETQGFQLHFTQSQVHEFDSLIDDSQMSPFPTATQDVGFQDMTPIKGRFNEAPPSTVDTLVMDASILPETVDETPMVKKKGRLHRRAPVVAFSDDEEDLAEPLELEDDDLGVDENVFDMMRKASKKTKKRPAETFDKKKSNAKEMVNEQAEESEDEYAGLGGASDDESGGEADEFVKAMIDDEGGKDIDESKLAAFYADRERINDEKQVEKLYKDIQSGLLRRKRGADYDLSDSDDGGEARRRMKRREFAKMRKALLADERIGKIAENPKREAFLRAIEDRGSGDEMDFLDDFAEQEEDSQSQSQAEGSQQVIPSSQPTEMGPPKRKRSDDSQEAEARLPPNLRRTKAAKKPSNISEIRESLSSLIEEPNSMISHADSGSESEDELEIEGEDDLGLRKHKDKENRDPFTRRRTQNTVIDRISLKRATSSNISNNTRLAFATSSSVPGFKVPALLRRATTNSSIVSSSSSASTTERTAGGSGMDGVKRGGGKTSGVNYFARESERRAAVEKTEKRREQKRFKGAEVRRKVVGGLFGGGKFE